MKKYCILFLLLAIGHMGVYAQKKLTISEEPGYVSKPHDKLGENEALVILTSLYQLTFDSTMDKVVNVVKGAKEGDVWNYHLKLSTLPRYNGRILLIKTDVYETLRHNLSLKSGDVLGLQVSDPFAKELSKLELLRDEGDALFNKSQYTEARTKYQEALSAFNPELDMSDDKAAVSSRLHKAQVCVKGKALADTYYNTEKWGLAFTEYEKIIGMNTLDNSSRERMNQCRIKRINERRVITGIVRDNSGTVVSGATVVPGTGGNIRGTKANYNQHQAVKTDNSGKYQIVTTYATTKLKCWKETTSFGAMEVDVFDDVVNIALRTGSQSTGSSSKSTTNNATSSESSSSSSKASTSSSSKSTKSKSTITRKKPQ